MCGFGLCFYSGWTIINCGYNLSYGCCLGGNGSNSYGICLEGSNSSGICVCADNRSGCFCIYCRNDECKLWVINDNSNNK